MGKWPPEVSNTLVGTVRSVSRYLGAGEKEKASFQDWRQSPDTRSLILPLKKMKEDVFNPVCSYAGASATKLHRLHRPAAEEFRIKTQPAGALLRPQTNEKLQHLFYSVK